MTSVSLDDCPVPELIRRQGERASGRLAVRSRTDQLTYRELLRRARRLSEELVALDRPSGTPVGVCLPRGPRFVAAALGVLESGAPALPIDPATPSECIDGILAAAEVTTCLTDRAARGADTRAPAEQTAAPELLLQQGSWVTQMTEAQAACPLTPGDTMLHAAAVDSPDARMEIFWPLCVGAKVVTHHAADPTSRLLACQRSKATVMVISARMLAELLDVQRRRGLMPSPWLRYVLCTDTPGSADCESQFARQMGRFGSSLHFVPGEQRLTEIS